MNKIQKYFEELSNISKKDLLAIFYNLLKDEKVSYVELSTIYTQYLQDKNEDNNNLITELGMSLMMYKDKKTGGTWKQAETKANKALISSKLFKGTPYEEKLKSKING